MHGSAGPLCLVSFRNELLKFCRKATRKWYHIPNSSTMFADDVITEDVVSSTILSFSSQDFLYTGTVCKSWRRNRLEHWDTIYTNVLEAIRSCSRLQEALSSGLDKSGVLNMAVVFKADASVLRFLSKDRAAYTSDMADLINYAAFVGNLDAVKVLSVIFDDFRFGVGELFDAVRGGHIDVVGHILEGLTRDEINHLPAWRLYWSDDYDETWEFSDHIDFWCNITEITANTSGLQLISESIDLFFVKGNSFRRSTTTVMSCMDLAIKTNRLDIVRVLREAGAALTEGSHPMDSTQLAWATCDIDMIRYLQNKGLRMDRRTLFDAITTNNTEIIQFILDAGCIIPSKQAFREFLSCELFEDHEAASLATVEFLLKKNLVRVDDFCIYGDMLQLVHRSTVDMLLERGYCVTDATVDNAIEQWDFEFACRLMRTYGRRPTAGAYKCLLLKGFHYDHALFDDFDFEVCLEKFEWLCSLGCSVGFKTLVDMQADREWEFIFARTAYYTDDVEEFFREQLSDGIVGVGVGEGIEAE